MGGGTSLSVGGQGEGWGPTNALLSEITNRPGLAGRAAASALSRRREDGAVEVGARSAQTSEDVEDGAPEVVVGASGNLANVYFLAEARRLSLEEIETRYPGLVDGLVAHPGIGFVLVRSDAMGPLAIGRDGVHHLADERIDGTDPLAPFGPRAADALRRLDGFAHVGDLLVNSTYDPDLEEVAAFEELVGSHGGFGGPQVRPFVLAPADLPYDGEPVVGAPAVHRLLTGWARLLGVDAESGATEAPPSSSVQHGRPRAIGLIAVLTSLTSIMWLLGGALFLFGAAALTSGDLGDIGLGDLAALTGLGIVLFGLGLVGMAVSMGLWRRRGWARMATLLYYAIGVLQALAAIGSGGLSGLFALGLIPVLIALFAFFYLTRPHVAAAFRQEGATVAATD